MTDDAQRWVVFDLGETLVSDTDNWGRWADFPIRRRQRPARDRVRNGPAGVQSSSEVGRPARRDQGRQVLRYRHG